MASYTKPAPFPLPPIFNETYFQARDFITEQQGRDLFVLKDNPVITGNLTVSGSTSLTTLQVNTSIKVGSTGTTINGVYIGTSGNLTVVKNTTSSFQINFGQTITGTKRIFPSLHLVSGIGRKNYIANIIDIQNTYFVIEIHSDDANDNTCRIDYAVFLV